MNTTVDLKKTKLAIFDFDSTLINTPLPDSGRIEYEKKTGKAWPYNGWWGHPESLNFDIFEMSTNPSVIADYRRERSNENTLVVMLTGRMSKLAPQVEAILKKEGLEFDLYMYNTGGSTDVVKLKEMNTILNEYPDIEVVEMWEDRELHIIIFEEWGKNACLEGKIKDFKINKVFNNGILNKH